MIILSHRGYWLKREERNQNAAFVRSFQLGFGTETDLRDANGKIVISHDMPNGTEPSLNDFLDLHQKYFSGSLPLALNIKADGLAKILKKSLSERSGLDAFVFDMAVPDMRSYFDEEIPVFTRLSEVETLPVWFEHAAGVWLDSFGPTWFDAHDIERILLAGKRVCVVSSELHQRDHTELWKILLNFSSETNLMICTDVPEQAREYFQN